MRPALDTWIKAHDAKDYAGCRLEWFATGERGPNCWPGFGYVRPNSRPVGPLFSCREEAEYFVK